MANKLDIIKNINSELDTTVLKLEGVDKKVIAISENLRKAVGGFSDFTLPKDLESSTNAANTQIANLNKNLDREKQIVLQLTQQLENLRKKRGETTKKTIEERVATVALRKELRIQAKSVLDLGSAYDNLSAQNNQLIRERQNLAIRQKLNNDLTEEEIKRLNELTSVINKNQRVLSETDQEIGNFRRNVGNYASAYDGLGNSINQITREFPAFTVSAQTGFLALSNNIPILADEISRLIATNKQLIAQGEQVQSVFSRITKAVFSWQTLLVAGITILTLYGKEITSWIGSLFKSESALSAAAKAQESLNKAQEEAIKTTANEIAELKLLLDVASDVERTDNEREKAAQKVVDTYGELITNTDKLNILNGQSLVIENKIIDALFRKATLQALINEASDEFETIAKKQNEIRKINIQIEERAEEVRKFGLVSQEELNRLLKEGNLEAANKLTVDTELSKLEKDRSDAQADLNKAQEEANEILNLATSISDLFTLSLNKNTIAQKQAAETLNESLFRLLEFRLQNQIDTNKKISEDENKSTSERIIAAQKTLEKEKELAKLRNEFELARINLDEENRVNSAKKEIKNKEELSLEIQKIEEDSNNKRTLENERYEKENIQIVEDSEKEKEQIFSDAFKKRVQQLESFSSRQEKELQNEITKTQDSLRERGASEIEIEEAVNFEIRKLRIKQLKELIDLTLQELKVIALSAEERELLEIQLAKLRAQLSDEQLEQFLTTEEKRRKILKESFEGLSNTLKDTFGISSSVTSAFFESLTRNFEEITSKGKTSFRNIADIAQATFALITEAGNAAFQSNIDNIDRQIQASNDYYNGLLENEELSDEQREGLELRRDQREEQLTQKRNDQLVRQARFNKIFNVAQIASQAAVASISALAPPPVGLGPVLGASLLPFILGTAAAQTALVLAQPLPQFAEGKNLNDNYEGLGIWGERKQELKISKDGTVELSPKRIGNHLTYVKKDDIIIPDAERYLRGFSDMDLTSDLQRHVLLANISHQNYLANSLESTKNSNDLVVSKLDTLNSTLERKKMRVVFNQNMKEAGREIAKGLKFQQRKNNTL